MLKRNWLVALREEKKLKQNDVAKGIGISQQYYQMIEDDKRKKILDLSLMQKLSDFFGVTLEFIAKEEEKKEMV